MMQSKIKVALKLCCFLLIGTVCFKAPCVKGQASTEASMTAEKVSELAEGLNWFNVTRALGKGDLRNRAVLLDFWTYCCINCMHVIPDLQYLERKFGDKLLVIGVHCGKFDAEKDGENIRQALLRYEIRHPVLNDANFKIWRALGVHAWPTLALFAPDGKLVGTLSGEGHREDLERAITKLLEAAPAKELTALPLAPEADKSESKGLSFPGKIFADGANKRLFIADSNHNRIVIATIDGSIQSLFGSGKTGKKDAAGEEAEFNKPQGLVLIGNILYVADTGNHLIRALDLSSKRVSTVAGTGSQGRLRRGSGPGLSIPLNSPWDLASSPDGKSIFVAMAGSHQLWRFEPASGTISWFAGEGGENIRDGSLSDALFAQPSGLCVQDNFLYVADSETSSIRQVSLAEGKVKTLIGTGLFAFGDMDGSVSAARLQHPLGVATGTDLHVADSYNNKIKIIDIPGGKCRTLEFQGLKLAEPGGLALLGGKLYVADTNNHRIVVIDPATKSAAPFVIEKLAPPKENNSPTLCPLPPEPADKKIE